ncbi:MAG: hypothetical protein FWG10_06655 [Eubacteriaceae bacterium]|nr:hypothetical protein [Eubacteriaceae bacterium]
MVNFKIKYNDGDKKCVPAAVISWEPSWDFESLDIVLLEKSTGKEVSVKNVLKRMQTHEEQVETSNLQPGRVYTFEVCCPSGAARQKLDSSQLGGDVEFEVAYPAYVFYHVENISGGWAKVYLFVDGEMPVGSIKVARNKNEYLLPAGSSPADGIYVFRMACQPSDTILLRSSVKTITPIKLLGSLQSLQEEFRLRASNNL